MVILGLGSNIGDRQAHLAAAVRGLSAVLSDMRLSRVLESTALLPPGAPADWNRPYLNMAVGGNCALAPHELLAHIKGMEKELGRTVSGLWGPREIDIDILAIDEMVMDSPELALPHPELVKRDFALLPLMDVAPDWRYPVAGTYFRKTTAEIIALQGFALGNGLRDTGVRIYG